MKVKIIKGTVRHSGQNYGPNTVVDIDSNSAKALIAAKVAVASSASGEKEEKKKKPAGAKSSNGKKK